MKKAKDAMRRRSFIKYSALGSASGVLAACQRFEPISLPIKVNSPAAKFGDLEKKDLIIGFIPTIEAAPLIIAAEQGFFARYGLNVNLSKQSTGDDIRQGLVKFRFDAAIAPFSLPLISQLNRKPENMVGLMVVNINSGAITLNKKLWEEGLRPGLDYVNFTQFTAAFRRYIRNRTKKLVLAVESYDSMDNFLLRYWLGSMGINPDKEVKIQEIPPSQLIFKLEAGLIDGYSVSEPWNQTAVLQQAGFTTYLNRDIWRGYPSKVLAAMNVWTTTNPNTARAVVAALLTAAKFIDTPENATLVGEILAQAKYLNTDRQNLEPSLNKNYNYGNLDGKPRLKTVDDLSIFSGRNITYLQPYQANYPWHSCAAWLLTQLIRWDRLTIRQYPENAPQLLGQIYPLSIYKDVAKALKIDIPNDSFKVEPAEAFIDSRSFDPQAAVAYLNSFTVRS